MAKRCYIGAIVLVIVARYVSGAEPKSVSIALSSILSTSGQPELKTVTPAFRIVDGKQEFTPTSGALKQRLESAKGQAASSVFLVDAPDEAAAITVSTRVFARYKSADYPATLDQPKPPRGNHWLVVFTGIAGSGPVRWIVDSVTIANGNVRFNYHKNQSGFSTDDIRYYYFWVPLGKLDDRAYELELYETNLKAITLMRRVDVSRRSQ